MASGTGLLDQRSCTWDGPLLEVVNVTAEADKLSFTQKEAAAAAEESRN